MDHFLARRCIFTTVFCVATSTPVMAATVWEVTAVNDTGVSVTDIELTLSGIGSGILGPLVAVNPSPAVFTAPPPLNELGANWAPLFLCRVNHSWRTST